MKSTKNLRYAVVGLGHIAQVAVLPAFQHAKKNSTLAALVTGTPNKGKMVAKKYGVKQVVSYEEYEELLGSGLIDAVYIALPNRLHYDYTCRALSAGISVLCEKPLALSSDDCARMSLLSDEHKTKLMTAYRLHFDKPTMDAIQLCRKGKLGHLKSFVSSFSYVIKDMKNIRMQPEDGGGPLWDIGIYCINAARYVFKENPIEVFAYSARLSSGPFSKVDETVTALLRFSEDRTATFTCSFNSATSSYFEVYGDKGKLRLENAFEYAIPPELHVTINEKKTKKTYKKVDQFAAELLYFSDCVLKDKKIEPSGEEGLIDVAIIEALKRSTVSGRTELVTYGGLGKASSPKPTMVETLPPVKKPDLVMVHSASGD